MLTDFVHTCMYLLQWLVVGVVQIGKLITQFENATASFRQIYVL